MWPLALVRIYLGIQTISIMFARLQLGYLDHPYVSERLNLSAFSSSSLYFEVFKDLVQSQWLLVTYFFLFIELVIGISYILGLAVRITSVLGMILSLHIYFFFEFATSPGQIYMFYIHLLFCLLGAGRCLGLDFYFYKSRRGLLW